jgi:hypothetical protein
VPSHAIWRYRLAGYFDRKAVRAQQLAAQREGAVAVAELPGEPRPALVFAADIHFGPEALEHF